MARTREWHKEWYSHVLASGDDEEVTLSQQHNNNTNVNNNNSGNSGENKSTSHENSHHRAQQQQRAGSSTEQGNAELARRVSKRVSALYVADHPIPVKHLLADAYVEQCEFVDPLVHAKGRSDVAAQFELLRAITQHTSVHVQHCYLSVGPTGGSSPHGSSEQQPQEGKRREQQTLLMDMLYCFMLWMPWPLAAIVPTRLRRLSIHVHSTLVLSPKGRVVSHKDEWSIVSLLFNLPFVAWLYGVCWRLSFGKVSGIAWRGGERCVRGVIGGYNGVIDRVAAQRLDIDLGTSVDVDVGMGRSKIMDGGSGTGSGGGFGGNGNISNGIRNRSTGNTKVVSSRWNPFSGAGKADMRVNTGQNAALSVD